MDPDRSSERETLLRRAAEGDADAQATLLESFRQPLRRMIAMRLDRRVAARLDASDVVQEAINNAHGRLAEYLANPQISLYPWLRRIACDRLADAYRRHIGAEKRSVLREHVWRPDLNDESVAALARGLVASTLNPGRRIMLAEMQARMKAALLELRAQDREILVLRYLEHLSVQEIAESLGISHTSVTSRHLRALQRLRGILGDEFGS